MVWIVPVFDTVTWSEFPPPEASPPTVWLVLEPLATLRPPAKPPEPPPPPTDWANTPMALEPWVRTEPALATWTTPPLPPPPPAPPPTVESASP